jgi:hypothetical protein
MLRTSSAFVLLLVSVFPVAAAPRDELLRVAPPDAALLVLVQNGREHIKQLDASPFAKWLPQSALGKQLLAGADLKQAKAGLEPLFAALGIKPEELISDVLGDAAAFAYTPAPNGEANGERAVLLIRPGKPETLARLIAKLNEIQTANGEVKSVTARKHRGEEYFERQKPSGPSDFYCFRGGVFAFSSSEADVRSVIDREKDEAKPVLAARIEKLGAADSLVVALINPRHFDRDLAAKLADAKPAEKAFLERFHEAWLALDSAAVHLALNADLELGVSIQFQPGKTPAFAKGWLTGSRETAAIWSAIPNDALVAFAGKFRASELVEALSAANAPMSLKAAAEQVLGPVFGKDKLPQVLAALGPQWALWAEPPKDGFLPVVAAAVQVEGKAAEKALDRGLSYGFNALRIAYNAGHTDQIELVETDDGITSLVNEKGFPPGFQPSYAFKHGYLLIAGSPRIIKRFEVPKPAAARGEAVIARISAVAIRSYLQTHGEAMAKFLAAKGQGGEQDLVKQFQQAAALLELADRIELATRGDDTGLRVTARLRLAKPLK